MARIAGVDLPANKRAEIGLTYIYGIGRSRANKILGEAGINVDTRIRELTEEEINRIRTVIDQQGGVEGDLRKQIQMDIKRMACATAEGFRFAGNGHTRMRAPAKGRAA